MNEREQELMEMPYDKFVEGLFVKPADAAGRFMHAAIGIMGEVVELRDAADREEALEECGDLMFYCQALLNTIGNLPKEGGMLATTVPQCFGIMLASASTILDIAKKVWVYEQELDSVLTLSLAIAFTQLNVAFRQYARMYGFDRNEILDYNRKKLLKRYPGATYTDAAAQARADKVPE